MALATPGHVPGATSSRCGLWPGDFSSSYRCTSSRPAAPHCVHLSCGHTAVAFRGCVFQVYEYSAGLGTAALLDISFGLPLEKIHLPGLLPPRLTDLPYICKALGVAALFDDHAKAVYR